MHAVLGALALLKPLVSLVMGAEYLLNLGDMLNYMGCLYFKHISYGYSGFFIPRSFYSN